MKERVIFYADKDILDEYKVLAENPEAQEDIKQPTGKPGFSGDG